MRTVFTKVSRLSLQLTFVLLAMAYIMLPTPFAIAQDQPPDELVWQLVKDSADAGILMNFVAQFPNSQHVAEARDKIAALTDGGAAFDASAPKSPEPAKRPLVPKPKEYHWIDTAVVSDWRGQDRASSAGSSPIEKIGGVSLCDSKQVGLVAVCWTDRSGGYPSGVPSDFSSRPKAWCTYKKRAISVSTPQSGRSPGRVYVCQ